MTRDGSPRELQGMDWNASFDAMGQRHKNAVRVCQNEKVALIGEKFRSSQFQSRTFGSIQTIKLLAKKYAFYAEEFRFSVNSN